MIYIEEDKQNRSASCRHTRR